MEWADWQAAFAVVPSAALGAARSHHHWLAAAAPGSPAGRCHWYASGWSLQPPVPHGELGVSRFCDCFHKQVELYCCCSCNELGGSFCPKRTVEAHHLNMPQDFCPSTSQCLSVYVVYCRVICVPSYCFTCKGEHLFHLSRSLGSSCGWWWSWPSSARTCRRSSAVPLPSTSCLLAGEVNWGKGLH